MQVEQPKTLKQQLPRGWQKKLMDKTKRSDTHVSLVVNGKKEDLEVLEAAMELASKHQAAKKSIQKKLQKLTKHGST